MHQQSRVLMDGTEAISVTLLMAHKDCILLEEDFLISQNGRLKDFYFQILDISLMNIRLMDSVLLMFPQ